MGRVTGKEMDVCYTSTKEGMSLFFLTDDIWYFRSNTDVLDHGP